MIDFYVKSMSYSVDTAIQRCSVNEYKVSIYADGLWRTSSHKTVDDARNAVLVLLKQFEGKIGTDCIVSTNLVSSKRRHLE